MRQIRTRSILGLCLVLTVSFVGLSAAEPLGTAFTYQGRLIDANSAADGLYDFLFRLYDANVGGSKVGNDVLIADVDVIDGYFTLEMDFGGTVFNGDARWLQIGIRPGELNDPNKYAILRPRQQVAPTPYALYADMLDGLHALDFATVSHNHDLRYYTEAESDSRYVNVTGDAIAGTNIWVLSVDNTGTGNGIDGSGQDIAVRGTASAQTGVGVRGNTPGANGYGVFGYASGSSGTGVYGLSSNTGNFTNYGGYFQAAGTTGTGVHGEASNSGDFTNYGGYFQAAGGYGMGVHGVASNSGNFTNWGGFFGAAGTTGTGVHGHASNSGDYTNYGGWFMAAGSTGRGVYGVAAGGYGTGVYGEASNRGNYTNYGGYFQAAGSSGEGVHGVATGSNGRGVYGEASNSGFLNTNYGGYFRAEGSYGYGVYGEASNSSDYFNYGGYFVANGSSSMGVYGVANNSGAYTNYGGYFHAAGNSGRGVVGAAPNTYGRGVEGWGNAYDFYAGGPGTDYGSSSSIRWKRDIRPIDEALDKVMMLRGVYFNWDDEHGGQHGVGMVAEEVGQVLPEIVEYEENGIDATGMDYGKLTPLLVEAVKALKIQVDQLHKENVELRDRLVKLEATAAEPGQF